ncbi:hypothetical protein GGI43DRAFT_87686 [Trichoderma evansii]
MLDAASAGRRRIGVSSGLFCSARLVSQARDSWGEAPISKTPHSQELATGDDGASMGLSNAPEPARGLSSVCPVSVQCLPPARETQHRQCTRVHGAVGCGWADERFGPSSLGGWCAASVLRELPAGAPAIDSRQSAPSPSGPSSGRSGFGAKQIARRRQSLHDAVARCTRPASAQGACARTCQSSLLP